MVQYSRFKIKYKKEDVMGFFNKLKEGLSKTKNSFDEKINNVFSHFRKVDEDLLEELEEALIMSDVGMDTSLKIIGNLRERIKKEKIEDEEGYKVKLKEECLNGAKKPSTVIIVEVSVDFSLG